MYFYLSVNKNLNFKREMIEWFKSKIRRSEIHLKTIRGKMLTSSQRGEGLQQKKKGVDEVTPWHLTSALWPALMGQVLS